MPEPHEPQHHTNVIPMRSKETPYTGKHRAEGGSVRYIVRNCEEIRDAVHTLNPQDKPTRHYLAKKAYEFGCPHHIPIAWHDSLDDTDLFGQPK